jgi:hypothetical protein
VESRRQIDREDLTGNCSSGATCWIPALLTRISSRPACATVAAIISAIELGLVMSAGEKLAFTPNSATICSRVRSISAARPRPFSTTSAPAAASARAIPRPMPLVDPVISATLPARTRAADACGLTDIFTA